MFCVKDVLLQQGSKDFERGGGDKDFDQVLILYIESSIELIRVFYIVTREFLC